MLEIAFIQISKEELKKMIDDSINQSLKRSQPVKGNDDETLLKIDDLTKLLKVSKVTVHKWKKDGIIPYHRISNRIYFKKSEVMGSLKSVKLRSFRR